MSSPTKIQAAATDRQQALDFAQTYLDQLCTALRGLPLSPIVEAIDALTQAHTERRCVFLIGNGGSASTASHMANDLAKTAAGQDGGQGFRVIALTDNVPLLTAWANDASYDEVFARPLQGLAQPGDVLIAISGSGNSRNIIQAVQAAKALGLTTIGLLGRGGGAVRTLVDIAIEVPSHDYGPIEDAHLAINHLLTAYFRHTLARRHV